MPRKTQVAIDIPEGEYGLKLGGRDTNSGLDRYCQWTCGGQGRRGGQNSWFQALGCWVMVHPVRVPASTGSKGFLRGIIGSHRHRNDHNVGWCATAFVHGKSGHWCKSSRSGIQGEARDGVVDFVYDIEEMSGGVHGDAERIGASGHFGKCG